MLVGDPSVGGGGAGGRRPARAGGGGGWVGVFLVFRGIFVGVN